jgi:hypothetical protein
MLLYSSSFNTFLHDGQPTIKNPYIQYFYCNPITATCFLKTNFHIILPSVSRSYLCPLSFRFPYQNSVCFSLVSHTHDMTRPPYSPFIALTLFAGLKSCSCSLCSLLRYLFTFSLHGTVNTLRNSSLN